MKKTRSYDDYRHFVYPAVTRKQQLADGTPWFIAVHPNLPGCMADGPDPEAAMRELEGAREDYIESLLEDGLEVPVPLQGLTESTTSAQSAIGITALRVTKAQDAETTAVSRLVLLAV